MHVTYHSKGNSMPFLMVYDMCTFDMITVSRSVELNLDIGLSVVEPSLLISQPVPTVEVRYPRPGKSIELYLARKVKKGDVRDKNAQLSGTAATFEEV